MEAQQLVRVLVVAAAGDNPDVVLQALRREGISLYARDIDPALPLDTQLAAESWHLILAYIGNPQLPAEILLQQLSDSRQDIPCLVVAGDKSEIPRLSRLGAAAIYLRTELADERLLPRLVHRIQRELLHQQLRREHRRQTIALHDTEQRYQQLLQVTSDAICCVQQGLHIFCNPAYAELLALDASTLLHTPFLDLVVDADLERARSFLSVAGGDSERRCSLRFRHPATDAIRATVQAADVSFEGARCLQLRVSTEELGLDCRRERRQRQDLVTGLLNRAGMLAAINQAINEAVFANSLATLVVIAVEPLEDIRALLGRADCNLWLAEIGQLLVNWSPPAAIAGRTADGQFAVLIPGAGSSDIVDLQRQLAELDSAAARLTPRPVELHCDFGTAVITDDAINAEAVLARANHQRLQRLRRQQLKTDQDKASTLQALRQALIEESLIPAYQPTVSLLGDDRERYEIRIRIAQGEEILYPIDFLDLANQQGLGEQVDRAVINLALRQLQKSEDEGLSLTVNLTQSALLSQQFLPWLSATLRQARVSASQLILQASEIDIASTPETATDFCQQLQTLGLPFSLNHFGCTLDPMRLLTQLHCDYVKLDPSLLRDIDYDAEALERLQSLISALHARGILVIAPMIERIDLLPLLWQSRVNFVQGNSVRAPGGNLDFSFVQDEEIVLNSPPEPPTE